MVLRSVIFLILNSIILGSAAQNKLTGTIKNSESSSISGATIYLLSEKDSSLISQTVSSENGFFSLPLPVQAAFFIKVTNIGYADFFIKLASEGAKQKALVIELKNSTKNLTDVIIKSSVRPVRQKDGNFVYSIAEEKEFKASANLTDIFKLLPNVRIDADGTIYLANNVVPAIFVDGKPLMISNEERNTFLRMLTPEKVANIEIITNPSSRYDGEFKGIINITLQKDQNLGLTGTVNNLFQQNRKTYGEQSLSLDYNTKKVRYFTRLGYNYGTRLYRFKALQKLANTNMLNTLLNENNLVNDWNIQVGLNFKFSEKHLFEILYRKIAVDNERDRLGNLRSTNENSTLLVFDRVSINPIDYNQNQNAATINYTLKAKKLKVDFLSNYLLVKNRQADVFTETHKQGGRLQQEWKSDMKNNIQIFTSQVDATYSLKKGSLDVGIKFSTSKTDNQILFDTLTALNNYQPDGRRSNIFKYDEDISAAYISYTTKIKKLQLTTGLRIEQTQSISNSVTLDSVVKNKFVNFLPSLSATYAVGSRQDLSASFTIRITRPTFGFLNPFRTYNSAFNYWVGNPFLLPAVTTQFKLGYHYKRTQVEITAGKEKEVLVRFPLYDSATNEIAFLGTNMPFRYFANLSFSTPIKFSNWWNSTLQVMLYYNKENRPYLDKVYYFGVANYVLRWNQVFSLPRDIIISLQPVYESRGGSTIYIIKPRAYVDLSFQKSWLNNKLNTKVAFNDMFNTNFQYLIFRHKEIIDNQFSHWYAQQRLQVNITYNFGKSKAKAASRVVSDEERRL
jgi:ferric enterobactin receptor